MDSFREFPSDIELESSSEEAGNAADVAAAIGTDERRMHVRAYNYWVSLLDGRDFPSIEDLEPDDLNDFSGNSVLLDFTCGRDNPAIPYIGGAIREECGIDDDTRTISQVPSRSLLSRLTDHYMQIIANRAPVGFEAEFLNQRGHNICYRGILMPFSSDGEMIDFIYGVINWKKEGSDFSAASEVDPAHEPEPEFEAEPVPAAQALVAELPPLDPLDPAGDLSAHWPDAPVSTESDATSIDIPSVALDEDAGLADLLFAARETAEAAKAGEGRTRAALYAALSLAYDFALSARGNPEDFAELLSDSGVKAQARAPMTPVVKLVFGVDYDKARLTEFAAALSYADRQSVAAGGFQPLIAGKQGGLKALVAAERQARRPETAPVDRGEAVRAALREAQPLSLAELGDCGEFAVVVTRRCADGGYEPVAVVADEALTERAIRKAA